MESSANLASVTGLAKPTVTFQIYDQVTERAGTLQSFAAGVIVDVAASRCQLVNGVELLELLNGVGASKIEPEGVSASTISHVVELAEAHVRERLGELSLPFVAPVARMQLIMWPGGATR